MSACDCMCEKTCAVRGFLSELRMMTLEIFYD